MCRELCYVTALSPVRVRGTGRCGAPHGASSPESFSHKRVFSVEDMNR